MFPAVLALIVAGQSVFLVPSSLGQGDEIEIISQNVSSNFPDNITFEVTAAGPDAIEEVRVFLKPLGSDTRTYGYLDIEPGKEVSGEYVMMTGTGATHKPPGSVVGYSFEIRDAAGRVLRTEEKEYLYIDESLDWKEISEGILTVYYYGAFVENRARTVLETVQNTREEMGRVLGIKPEDPIKIVAYNNYRDMSRALPFRSQRVRQDLQTEGQAWPTERVLLVLTSEETFTGVASHEFTHILVSEAAGRGYSLVPAWLNEGLAEYGNVDQTPQYDWALRYAIFTRRLKPLWYLDNLGGEPDDIIIGYGHGKSVVSYLIARYGEGKMAELMRTFRTSVSTDGALKKVYGFDQYGLDTEWRQALGLEPLPSPEELESQLDANPSPTALAGAEPTLVPTPQVEATPAPAAEKTPQPPSVKEERPRSTRSCGAPAQGSSAGSPLDLAVLALLGAPFVALNSRWGLGGGWFVRGLGSLRRRKK